MRAAIYDPSRTGTTFLAALGLTALADFLLLEGQYGVSLFFMGLAVAVTALVINKTCGKQNAILGAGLYGLAVLPVLENVSPLSVFVFLILGALGTLAISEKLRTGIFEIAILLGRFFLTLLVRSTIDIRQWRKTAHALSAPNLRFARFGVWIMPVVISLIFLALFEDANPIIAKLIAQIDLWYLLKFFDLNRILFWLAMFVLIWPFLRARLPERKAKQSNQPARPSEPKLFGSVWNTLFGPDAILRALILFNAMFAVQTLLDATYLIGGVALPDGMTYVAYAHRGAYPLIFTALLSAAFVLIAMREGSAARNNNPIRNLVYFWVAQNVVLVLSSILRLDLYVGVYGLTYWRISALIWMVLVALGLLSIIWQIARNKDTKWLLGCNIISLSLTLYVSCFINFAGLIANYNARLEEQDLYYLTRLGPQALPALDQIIRTGKATSIQSDCAGNPYRDGTISLSKCREIMVSSFNADYGMWRLWSLRNWRLKRYLDNNPSRKPDFLFPPFSSPQ
jgi:Domain of unknown function (DUF4173)